MSKRKNSTRNGSMLQLWRPPEGAGEPLGCLATTYTFSPSLFDEQCLSRFLEIESEPDREELAFLLDREQRLGSVYAGVIVDHTFAGVQHSLRWDVLPARIRTGRQHAKLSVLAWSKHIRIIVSSANLTEPGYRTNYEVAAAVELSPEDADKELLAQAVSFLRSLLAFVPRGKEETPEVRRARVFLAQVERLTAEWAGHRRKTRMRQQFVCTLPAISSGQGERSSLREALAFCRRRGRSPHYAMVASPFFDDDSSRIAVALYRLMARGRTREICFCVPEVSEDGELAVPRLLAPKSLVETPLRYNAKVTVKVLPGSDEDRNHRQWHAKMLSLRGDNYTALMIGSSNFTCAGMGVTSRRNAELNLLNVAQRVAYGPEAGILDGLWPKMEPVKDLDAAEWIGRQSSQVEDENEPAAAVAPGIVSATYRAGDVRQIVVVLAPSYLPPEWIIFACGEDNGELLKQSTWIDMGSPEIATLSWLPKQPPDMVRVVWNGEEAFLPINVEDPRKLPPPSRLDQMSADEMLSILAATDPSAAIRVWARGRQSSDIFDSDLDSATPIDLDPLRYYDLEATFLHRIRRRARVMARLRANLQRPVWGQQSLDWRLRGIIGIEALAERLVRDVGCKEGHADEALLTVADFIIVLNEVDYQPSDGSLTRHEFDEVFRPFMRELGNKLDLTISAHRSQFSCELMGFWERVLDQLR